MISSDEIRRSLSVGFGGWESEDRVWKIFESEKRKALEERRNIVLDACHLSPEARWHAIQGPNGNYKKICIVFDFPWPVLRERCLRTKRVPLAEVERMWKAFRESKPTTEELKRLGFDEMYSITENPEYDARISFLNLKEGVVGKGRRLDTDTLLYAIIGEAEVALRRKNFEPQVEHIHRVVDVIENRMNDWETKQLWSEIDRLMAERAEGGMSG